MHSEHLEKRRERVERRSYASYRCRQIASERLDRLHFGWSTGLAITSAIVLIVGILAIGYSETLSLPTDLLSVSLSLAILIFSLVISQRNYGARSRDLFENYRVLQRISIDAERLDSSQASELLDYRLSELEERYQEALDRSENHTSLDHERHLWLSSSRDWNVGTIRRGLTGSIGWWMHVSFPIFLSGSLVMLTLTVVLADWNA